MLEDEREAIIYVMRERQLITQIQNSSRSAIFGDFWRFLDFWRFSNVTSGARHPCLKKSQTFCSLAGIARQFSVLKFVTFSNVTSGHHDSCLEKTLNVFA